MFNFQNIKLTFNILGYFKRYPYCMTIEKLLRPPNTDNMGKLFVTLFAPDSDRDAAPINLVPRPVQYSTNSVPG
jgi:hypothetical protein